MLTPYLNEASYRELLQTGTLDAVLPAEMLLADRWPEAGLGPAYASEAADDWEPEHADRTSNAHYGKDLMAEVARYALATARRVRGRQYDLVHAHDWMTFPAGILVAKETGAPLFVHIHSLEFDRAAEGADPAIVALERQGLDACTRAIAVSHYTRSLIHKIHGTPLSKISVVHNGVRAYAAQ
jgi:glycosyltransferase involved in cell wall biosynthesis